MRWLRGFTTASPGYILFRTGMDVFHGPWQIFFSCKMVLRDFHGERGILSLLAKCVIVTSKHYMPLMRRIIGYCWISSDPANKESKKSGSN